MYFTATRRHYSSNHGLVDGAEARQTENTDDPECGFDAIRARGDEHISQIARQLTKYSTVEQENVDIFHARSGSELDPNSPNFNPIAWAKCLTKLEASDAGSRRSSGVAFRNLSAYGYGKVTNYQKDVGNIFLALPNKLKELFLGEQKERVYILHGMEALVDTGEMLMVLGPPGSGCSTFLKAVSGETHGIYLNDESGLNYRGISAKKMHKYFRGEAIYTAETDIHFPILTVGDTLSFAAAARRPRKTPGGVNIKDYSRHLRDVAMAIFGISHTVNTRVGSDYVRGVSGGERKRVSIAEAALSGSPLQCWDNSTRGLDSANAVEFCKTLRASADIFNTTSLVAIYQAPQEAYDLFDKVTLLYDGRQIFFGRISEAKKYFEDLGFHCPSRQTTPDFLTSMTRAGERNVKPGFEGKAPRTAKEFEQCWKESEIRESLLQEINRYEERHPIDLEDYQQFNLSRIAQKAKSQRFQSPYTISYLQQTRLCLSRGILRLIGDPSLTLTQLGGNFLMALVIGSVFFDLQPTTNSFYGRGALLFFALLLNAFGSALEILTLYEQRPIIEKHKRYALYHPSSEAISSILTDLPYKAVNALIFDITLYFMANLRREAGPFFFFYLVTVLAVLSMSSLYRTVASLSRTMAQAMVPAALLTLGLVIYTGFTLPVNYMPGWSRWMSYINPLSYAFESLLVNEFNERQFQCSLMIPSGPGYANASTNQTICAVPGAQPGSIVVDGAEYLKSSYRFYHDHKWRNVGIMVAFWAFFTATYLIAAELVTGKKSKGEVLVFQRGRIPPALLRRAANDDVESGIAQHKLGVELTTNRNANGIKTQTSVFHWQNVSYDIKVKGEDRRVLEHVDGWVRPGTLTALMGPSGAGKTTLLDVLATRVTTGIITGDMFVDGKPCDASFQRRTGYVQQQDVHLATSTVKEALRFSAILRQPSETPRKKKFAYVDEVIKLLGMEEYADAVVGTPGEDGLNIEQRKRLSIGIELAARPQLLLFLDEPTSGLDSQTSWSICALMRDLAANGQAILCTIHQPSSMLFQQFDRLLLLTKGGRTVYFGDTGESSSTLVEYFEKKGAPPCPDTTNPAEWMLHLISAGKNAESPIDWHQVWLLSPEYQQVQAEMELLKKSNEGSTENVTTAAAAAPFASPFLTQWWEAQKRIAQQYWRNPTYIYSKLFLCALTSLYIGFSFYNAPNSLQGLQNQMYGVFMLMTIFGQLNEQIMPQFVAQRALYEVRERASKMYSWQAFILSNILIEIPWNTLMAGVIYLCWYYPVGWYRNAESTNAVTERGATMFLFVWTFMLFVSTFTHLIIAGMPTAETAGSVANICFMLCVCFCGVVVSKAALPGFWIFMYRISPFTYLLGGMLSTALARAPIECAANEVSRFLPAANKTCGQYMTQYISQNGGYLLDANTIGECGFCRVSSTDEFLDSLSINFTDRWRNFGLMWVYIAFNIIGSAVIYWLVRVPREGKKG